MLLLLGGVARELLAVRLGRSLGGLGAEARDRLGRVAVLPGVAGQLVARSAHRPTSAVEGVLEHVVLRPAPPRSGPRPSRSLLKLLSASSSYTLGG